jgi:hypothetical protein
MAVKKAEDTVYVAPLSRGVIRLRIIGQTPMFQNRMAAKAMQQLLVGGRKKTAADKANIKHAPLQEYRDSMEQMPFHGSNPTLLGLRVVAVKAAMCTAALETAGITKTSAQRLLFMPGDLVPLYGTPQLRMDVVRSADINRTPDVRTRAFLPRWGAEIEIQHILPQLPMSSVITLACNAGVLVGVGDFRQEKGKGAFGSFRAIPADQQDDEWDDLVENHGYVAQRQAFDEPTYAGDDTSDLMDFFHSEVKRRK